MKTFSRGRLTFPVRDSGDRGGDRGAPIAVLLHGFPQDPASWDRVTDGLVAAGWRTLVPTQRGYAETARPSGRWAYRISELVADVVTLIDTSGADRVHLVGHDWGGGVAWATAAAVPERLSGLTVLSTPHPGALARSLVTSGQALRSWYMGFFQLPVLPELALSRTLRDTLTAGPDGLPPEVADRLTAMMADPATRTAAINWYRGGLFSLFDRVGPARVPTTYVWGSDDPFLGRAAAEHTGDHVEAPYRFVELDAGHWLPELHPDAVVRAVLDPPTDRLGDQDAPAEETG
ncbi:alpha/beta fold hydrolase [Nakamurella leprariae]|uniref:Alpha/beta fold hydrolase n=1 Tax=Nakamurella leprariae TaxID=2803911 RepID=A0A938YCX7_9ACTN|nr:alpha/beta fold hydrolase [Nakamurella leprariae]MBM9468362.1 alpha/beta fold hydrolase [Nakamurella leprariae]